MGRKKIEVKLVDGKYPRILRGLPGICALFGVSKTTAYKYSRTIIKDACTKNGGVIIVNTKKALELFGCDNPEEFLQ